MKSDLVDLEALVIASTEKAVCISATGEKKDAVWVPLSQCEVDWPEGGMAGKATVTMPEWLALDKGLI